MQEIEQIYENLDTLDDICTLIDQNIADHNKFHQIWNAEPGMIHGETIHRGAKFFQGNPSIGHNHKSIITSIREKVMTNF